MLKGKKIGFIGAGQMCEAILTGLLRASAVSAGDVIVCDIAPSRIAHLTDKYGVTAVQAGDGPGLVNAADIVVFSVEPHAARALLPSLAKSFNGPKLAISIMGGVTLALLQEWLPGVPVIRVMPNTAAQVNAGAAGIAAGTLAKEGDIADCKALFDAVGESFVIPEGLMDPLTSLSGCGPAFACMFIEALADGGVEGGLSRAMAQQLAAQTVLGAAQMILRTGRHPAQLKDAVCSPGGGTVAGVHALEKGGLRAAVMGAVGCARARMAELGKPRVTDKATLKGECDG